MLRFFVSFELIAKPSNAALSTAGLFTLLNISTALTLFKQLVVFINSTPILN